MTLVLSVTDLQARIKSLESQNKTLPDAGIRLVDLRSAEAYAAGHIPGAVHGNAALLNRSEPPVGGLMPEPDSVNRFLEQIGARLGDQIIAYDGGLETPAARLIWVMDAYGYEACSWLDGGYRAWLAAQLESSTTATTAEDGTLQLSLIGDNAISVDHLMEQLDDNEELRILDVRSAGEFKGLDRRADHAGHVPGAEHALWTSMLDEHGRLLDDATLQAQLSELDVTEDSDVIVYCQTHQRSAVTYVVLKHLGYAQVRAIDGAWSAWGNRIDTPKHLA